MATVRKVAVALVLAAAGYGVMRHPPVATVMPGEMGLRTNAFSGDTQTFGEGPVWLFPGVHELRRYSLRDRVFRDADSMHAAGNAPFQSSDGLSLGVDLTIRYALDPAAVTGLQRRLPEDIDRMVVAPMLRGVAYRTCSRYTVKEIFTTSRSEIQAEIEKDLTPRLKAEGIVLRGVDMGRVDLPAEYRAGLERMLQQQLETEQMKHTLLLREQQVKQAALEAQADLVRREKNAEAAAREQVISAKAQADAMLQVIVYKHRQIEQRKLEAEADKVARIGAAEAGAEARRLEAAGDADARRKLADTEIYRAENLARVSGDQMEREGLALSRHPLLVQKEMADKLSDKIQLIVMPPGKDGEIIDSALLGRVRR